MRYIILAVFSYSLYLFLKFLLNAFFKPRAKSGMNSDKTSRKLRKDLDKIEEAEYEEIKK